MQPTRKLTIDRIFFLACALAMPMAVRAAAPTIRADKPYEAAFTPLEARFVRIVIQRTSGGVACLDELEVYGPDGKTNLALASAGAKASASSCLEGHPIHQIAHLNDGKYGNSHSWIASGANAPWAQIELPNPATIAKVVISRDREGHYHDRMPIGFEIQTSLDGKTWKTVHRVVAAALPKPAPYAPGAQLPNPVTFEGLVKYAFLCERATWQRMNRADHLSPWVVDRPALPGGEPYWSRIAKLSACDRVLTQMEEMAGRLAAKGLDVNAEKQQMADFRKQLASLAAADEESLYLAIRLAKRRLMFRDPDLARLERVLFIERHPYLSSHNYSDVLDSRFTPGGGVCILNLPHTDGRLDPDHATVTRLFDAPRGIARDAFADFDAKTVYFAYRPDKTEPGEAGYWHLMSVGVDGKNPRQLTEGPFHDYYPCPMPDGGLCFISTRCRARFLCWRPQAFVLFRMNANGDDIRPLSFANLSEWSPTMMRDGRILWTRSEYIDKGADFGHTLWSVRPDGTHPELVFGNNTPNCYINGREVPGTREILCTIFSHGGDHNGPLGLVDTSRGPADVAAVTNITPDVTPHYNMSWPRNECFRDPTPITRDYFLASHAPADRFGLYLVDRYGNRELLRLDPAIGNMCPTVLAPTVRPPVLGEGDLAAGDGEMGQFTVADVYRGLEPAVPRGTVKYIRVCQEVRADLEQLADGTFRADHPSFPDFYATPVHKVRGPFGWTSYVAKASLGLARVEEDGSANFLAPSGKVIYFEALDENLNELQRMRSVVQLQPGESRGCVGCHEDRRTAAPASSTVAARRLPQKLEAPPWGAEPFSYERVVQPILTAKCVSCHNEKDAKGLNLTAKLDEHFVPASYRTLVSGGWVHYFDMTYGLRHKKAEPTAFGTLQSKLRPFLEKEHEGVRLTRDEMHAVKCWIDLNCPLWPDYQYRPDRQPKVAGAP